MALQTRTLTFGDPAPWFALEGSEEKHTVLRDRAGHPTLIVFFAQDSHEPCQKILETLKTQWPAFEKVGAQVFSISLDDPQSRRELHQKLDLPFTLLSDAGNSISQQYGVLFPSPDEPGTLTYSRTAVLLDENLRVLKVYPLTDGVTEIPRIAAELSEFFPYIEPVHITHQAPVLLIPRVFHESFCKKLIDVWHTQGNEDSGFMMRDGDKTVGIYDYSMKIRRDHFVMDDLLKGTLDRAIQRRVFPEIEKAFNYKCSRREEYKISCYDSEPGGYFRPHRDNTSGGTAHRRFAMTINLNTEEFEGGYLRFNEYSPNLYRPATGDCIIFSGSIMHEATDVTAGKRFALLAFFYGEKEAADRLAYTQKHGDTYEVRHLSEAPQS